MARRTISESRSPDKEHSGNPYLAAALAWLLPGAGHLYLGRRERALVFFVVVFASLTTGCLLEGQLYRPTAGQPLLTLAAYASMGVGAAYFVLQQVIGYTGDSAAGGFEYGKAFILTSGLMNILLILDVLDIGRTHKE